jgi:hypothetical protein
MENGDVALVISIVGTVVAFLAHLRVKSMCCGKEVSIEVSQTSPKK